MDTYALNAAIASLAKIGLAAVDIVVDARHLALEAERMVVSELRRHPEHAVLEFLADECLRAVHHVEHDNHEDRVATARRWIRADAERLTVPLSPADPDGLCCHPAAR